MKFGPNTSDEESGTSDASSEGSKDEKESEEENPKKTCLQWIFPLKFDLAEGKNITLRRFLYIMMVLHIAICYIKFMIYD